MGGIARYYSLFLFDSNLNNGYYAIMDTNQLPAIPVKKIQRVNELGQLVEIDMITGQTIVVQDLQNMLPSEKYQYTTQIGEIIAGLIREGTSLAEVGDIDGMPDRRTILAWRRRYPDFGEKIRQALEDSAYVYAAKVNRVAEELEEAGKESAPGLKGAADQYRWLAEKYNPEQFGQKTKISGDANAPLQIIVGTGIQRNDPTVVDTEGKTVEEKTCGEDEKQVE